MKQIHQNTSILVQNSKSKIYKNLVLLSMCLNSITNIMLSTIVSPIWYQVAYYYTTNDYDLNWLIGWYYFGPILFSFPFNPLILNYYGLSQIISSLSSLIGLWILVIIKRNFWLAMLGFVFLGLGESLYCQTPLYLSKIWFEPDERIFITFIAQYANTLGCLIGYVVSSYYFFEIFDEQEFNRRFENLLFLVAILSIGSFLLSFLTLKQPINTFDKIAVRDTIWNSIKKICSHFETFLDLFSISTFIGLSWCYTMLLGTQQYYIGYTQEQIQITNIVFTIGQLFIAFICSYKLNKQSKNGLQQQYDTVIKLTISQGFLVLAFENLLFEYLPANFVIFLNLFIGGGLGGIYSIFLESLMEKHYPAQELVISTLFIVVACALSFSISMISIIPEFSSYGFQISCFFMIPSFCYILVFYKTTFQRFEFES